MNSLRRFPVVLLTLTCLSSFALPASQFIHQTSRLSVNSPCFRPFRENKNQRIQSSSANHIPVFHVASKNEQADEIDFLPNTLWIGVNGMYHQSYNSNKSQLREGTSLNADIGMGWYKIRTRIDDNWRRWLIYGAGIGFEYLFAVPSDPTLFNRSSGLPYNRYMLNIRSEISTGFKAWWSYSSLHLHLGYCTDFKYKYLRPGLGSGLGRFQYGVETLLPLRKNEFEITRYGIYLRMIVGKRTSD